MNFFVTILGSGAAIPTHERKCSSQVVNVNGFRMLMDCGEGTQNLLRHNHQKMQAMGIIFISHLHGDHIFGLPGLLSSMHLCGRTDPVHIFAPKGMQRLLNVLLEESGTHLQYELRVTELENTEPQDIFCNNRCKVTAFPLQHSVPTYGYLFEEVRDRFNLQKDARQRYDLTPEQCVLIKQGADLTLSDGNVIPNSALTLPTHTPHRYAYCCDTAYTEDILDTIHGVNLLCMESTFNEAYSAVANEKKHCTAAQSATLARKAQVDKLLLTHFSARYKDIRPLLDEAAQIFPNVIAANDGDIVEVK